MIRSTPDSGADTVRKGMRVTTRTHDWTGKKGRDCMYLFLCYLLLELHSCQQIGVRGLCVVVNLWRAGAGGSTEW